LPSHIFFSHLDGLTISGFQPYIQSPLFSSISHDYTSFLAIIFPRSFKVRMSLNNFYPGWFLYMWPLSTTLRTRSTALRPPRRGPIQFIPEPPGPPSRQRLNVTCTLTASTASPQVSLRSPHSPHCCWRKKKKDHRALIGGQRNGRKVRSLALPPHFPSRSPPARRRARGVAESRLSLFAGACLQSALGAASFRAPLLVSADLLRSCVPFPTFQVAPGG